MGILFGVPMMTSLSATGNIKQYQIVVSSIIIMILPVSYIVLSINDNVMLPFYIIILFTILSGIARFYFCIKQIRFNLKNTSTSALTYIHRFFDFNSNIPYQ